MRTTTPTMRSLRGNAWSTSSLWYNSKSNKTISLGSGTTARCAFGLLVCKRYLRNLRRATNPEYSQNKIPSQLYRLLRSARDHLRVPKTINTNQTYPSLLMKTTKRSSKYRCLMNQNSKIHRCSSFFGSSCCKSKILWKQTS